jgi:hypothetical protein
MTLKSRVGGPVGAQFNAGRLDAAVRPVALASTINQRHDTRTAAPLQTHGVR